MQIWDDFAFYDTFDQKDDIRTEKVRSWPY